MVDGLTSVFGTSHMFDTVDYRDNGDYYLLALTHSLGLNNSKLNLTTFESLIFQFYKKSVQIQKQPLKIG